MYKQSKHRIFQFFPKYRWDEKQMVVVNPDDIAQFINVYYALSEGGVCLEVKIIVGIGRGKFLRKYLAKGGGGAWAIGLKGDINGEQY
jgi:hypothetical protein